METDSPAQDLLHVLARDHRRFDERFRAFLHVPTRRGEPMLRSLMTDLLAHEAAEQLLLHPLVAERLPNGPALAAARIEEEEELERLVVGALAQPLASERFSRTFGALHRHLVEHTDREEIEVFPYVRHVVDRRDLRALGRLHTTLLVRIPTRLRYSTPTAPLGTSPRRPLLAVRDAACDVLRELGEPLPAGLRPGRDGPYAPVRGAAPRIVDVSDAALESRHVAR